jgi:hypothetical protein
MGILDEMKITHHLFEMWIPLIENMRFDFEYRRTMMAFTSLLLIDYNSLNPVIRDNLPFVVGKVVELCKKITEIKERKNEN